ncbi:hypothetical protein [Allocoleopsis sp.]|uniref:hypothetical protein n=1 Tax=Allocoleopsis sp. TaxID=3088169 RepID=UPI002FD22FFB
MPQHWLTNYSYLFLAFDAFIGVNSRVFLIIFIKNLPEQSFAIASQEKTVWSLEKYL